MKFLLLSLTFLAFNISAQMHKFPILEPINNSIPESFLIEGSENELLMFWIDSTDLHMSKSLDEGSTWGIPKTLVDNTNLLDSLSDLNVIKLKSGRIIITYKQKFHYSIYSDKYDLNWSDPIKLETASGLIRPRQIMESSLSQTNDGKIWFVYNRLNTIYNIQSDDGIVWSERDTMVVLEDGSAHFGSVNSHWNGSLVLVFQKSNDDTSGIYQVTSIDGGKTWSNKNPIIDDHLNKRRPRVAKDSSNALWLSYTKAEATPFEEFIQTNIYYSKLNDGFNSWSRPTKYTEYVGFDGWQNISIINNKPYISFTSDRSWDNTIWFGIADETNDSETPPEIFETNIKYLNDYPKVTLEISAKVFDADQIDSLFFHYQGSDNVTSKFQLFDDGFHNDNEAGDYIYGNRFDGLSKDFKLNVFYTAVDIFGNKNYTETISIESPLGEDGGETFAFDNNNLWFPINSRGVLADVKTIDKNGELIAKVHFDESTIIYSAGFTLSGYTNGKLWANGVATGSRILDYIHGPINSVESLNKIHVVRSSQPDFYQSWYDWKDAVAQGADFYDGNADGEYDPIDLNENGKWDLDEDKPNTIGDITAFTVFNDGVESQYRDYANVEPQGIEIKQTVFSYNSTTLPKLSNVIFVKYSIDNIGTVADKLDSVYFGAWADMDIGTYYDDLIGTDTALNSMYGYNDVEDEDYGTNPPACFISFIQAPPVYIEGDTYEDKNDNGLYDEGIDTPIDRAYNRKGKLLGVDEYPGAKNNGITASAHYFSGHPTQSDPDNEVEVRYYLLGHNQQGKFIDPCMWEFGEVFNEDCSVINPRFMYSGDPVTQSGWVSNNPSDHRQMGSTGPFVLVKDKPIEIIVAFIVGRGTDALNSITEARKNTQNAIDFYNTNFSYVPVGVNDKPQVQLPSEFSLSQNYPNPFNPSTTIRYSIPASQTPHLRGAGGVLVTLKIYDILGREVSTLVNKQQKAGNYEVQFNASTSSATASNLSSGVYFYRLQSGSFVETKKLILLK